MGDHDGPREAHDAPGEHRGRDEGRRDLLDADGRRGSATQEVDPGPRDAGEEPGRVGPSRTSESSVVSLNGPRFAGAVCRCSFLPRRGQIAGMEMYLASHSISCYTVAHEHGAGRGG